jgi:hypothetical protein
MKIGKAYSSGHLGVTRDWPFSLLFIQQEQANMFKSILIAGSILGLTATQSLAVIKPTCDAIDKAISANEDFVEVALGIDATSPADAIKVIHATTDIVSPALSPELAKQSRDAIAQVDAAFAAHKLPEAAVAAMENYAVLVKAFEPRLVTTLDVAMLDYAGFRLLGLVATNPVNWEAVTRTAADADVSMKATSTYLKNQGLTDLMVTMSTGLVGAAAAKDAAWEGHAAQVLLDSVDLMEAKARNKSKLACR